MLRNALICGLLWGSSVAVSPSALDPGSRDDSNTIVKGRHLRGKFLHVTDFHPDPFYKTYSSTAEDAACHRQYGPAGIYGAETSACDSPFSLINETFRWINDNVKDDIDFVIWTGDSARHDNDELIPRTQSDVIRQNEFMVSKFAEVFGLDDDNDGRVDQWAVPIVPTFGNNDILPHNIFLAGPNRWTTKYLDVWRSIIPEAQRHQFQQGGWFSVEVIPGRLAVISLNTLYFFSSNSGVDGCANKHEPGYEHMEWLRIQLQILRDRGLKAILMGHVPPARVDGKESWDETCWQKYTLWQRQFRDVIVGNLYGHMNIDHFMLQDFDQISKDAEKGRMASGITHGSLEEEEIGLYEDGEVTVAGASSYLLQLRDAWAQLPAPQVKSKRRVRSNPVYGEDQEDEDEEPSIWSWLMSMFRKSSTNDRAGKDGKKGYLEKIGGKYAERYSVTHVAPSIVPNYFPTLRIIEYNITGLEHEHTPLSDSALRLMDTHTQQQPIINTQFDDNDEYPNHVSTLLSSKKKPKKGPKKYKFKVPEGPSKSSPPGPAYSPQPLTWTRYTQYFANLTRINNDFVKDPPTLLKRSRITRSTNEQSPHTIFGLTINSEGEVENRGWKDGKHGKHQGKQPRPEPHPSEFTYEVEYDTRVNKQFPDLTVRRWVEYARKIGQANDTSAEIEKEEEAEEEFRNEQIGADSSRGGKKHKKKKGKKRKHRKASKEWFTFVRRAFVGTMDPHEIEGIFGTGLPAEEVQETLEL